MNIFKVLSHIDIYKLMSQSKLKEDPCTSQESKIKASLLDITYPYYSQSMLARSKFFGFECLMFECGIYFSLMYIISNFLNKGYLLKWDVLSFIADNFIHDVYVIFSLIAIGLLQMYLAQRIIKTLINLKNRQHIMNIYAFVWFCGFIGAGIIALSRGNFYFTDRIFIVVVSWALPVKTASFCIDQIHDEIRQATKNKGFVFFLKFLISPQVVYKEFLKDHDSTLKIHVAYLSIKALVAFVCLLVNYILLTQIINPLLQPSSYQKMSFTQLFFRLIPYFFYVNVCLYYLIMQNILLAMAELTQLKMRVFYLDWWNAVTVSQFLDKWVLLINAFSQSYMKHLSKRVRHALHLVIIFLMLFLIFGEGLTWRTIMFAMINILTVFFLGENKIIQSNYIVHFLTISFTPFTIAAQLKYRILDHGLA